MCESLSHMITYTARASDQRRMYLNRRGKHGKILQKTKPKGGKHDSNSKGYF